jgi:hypothetical protein
MDCRIFDYDLDQNDANPNEEISADPPFINKFALLLQIKALNP